MLVVGHGSRDADGVDEFWALAETIRAITGDLLTGFGFNELASPTVDEAVDDMVARGATKIINVPLVLLVLQRVLDEPTANLDPAARRDSPT